MKSAIFWLNAAQVKIDAKSDAELARKLNCSRQSISQQRHGKHNMSIRTALTIARILEINPMIIISTTMFHQAVNDDEREFWTETFKKYQNPERPI